MAHFEFLQLEWPALHEAAAKAESLAYPDPRTSCFHARRALELLVAWLYKHDASLRLPYQDNLGASNLPRDQTVDLRALKLAFDDAMILLRFTADVLGEYVDIDRQIEAEASENWY